MRLGLGDCVNGFDDTTGDPCGAVVTTDPTFTITPLNATQGDCAYGQAATGYCNPAPSVIAGNSGSSSGSSGSIAAYLASLTNAASGAIKAATTPAPYVLPGTNTLYNPATGQIVGSVNSSGALSTSALGGSGLLLLMLAGFAIFALEKR